MTTLLAVDGNSLAHRAFHASAPEERIGAFLTGAVVRMVATAWYEGPFDAAVIGFDHESNRRKDLEPVYKAHRLDHDTLLDEQLDELPRHLAACGFTVVCVDGAEADDVIAATAAACEARSWSCAILSSDRDLFALVSDRVRVLRPEGTFSNLRTYGPAETKAEFGIRPDQYTDYAALRGDPSDGLAGVPGIGPKTAARLVRDYGDVPAIYRSIHNLPPKLEAALRASRDIVDRNLLLMAPLPGVEVDVDAAVAAGANPDRVDATLLPLDQGWAAGRFRRAVSEPRPPLPPPPMEAPVEPAGPPERLDQAVPSSAVVVPNGPASGEQPSLF